MRMLSMEVWRRGVAGFLSMPQAYSQRTYETSSEMSKIVLDICIAIGYTQKRMREQVTANKTAPVVAPTTAGAWTRPTEAEQAAKLIMASDRASHKEPAHALPSLPDPRQALREGPEGQPALPL